MSGIVALVISCIPLALFSIIAFWKNNSLVFLITAGLSVFIGLKWFDVYTDNTGLAIGILILLYGFLCIGMAIKALFGRRIEE